MVQAEGQDLLVRGNRHRLRQLLEHLLNNAAQALAEAGGRQAGEEQAIRLSVRRDAGTRDAGTGGAVTRDAAEDAVHLTVSDTGPGFREPGRVFEPSGMLETMGTGLGLSLCYGIVHEHGGEIRAFNLEPHGAAVSVRLPALPVAAENADRLNAFLARPNPCSSHGM